MKRQRPPKTVEICFYDLHEMRNLNANETLVCIITRFVCFLCHNSKTCAKPKTMRNYVEQRDRKIPLDPVDFIINEDAVVK